MKPANVNLSFLMLALIIAGAYWALNGQEVASGHADRVAQGQKSDPQQAARDKSEDSIFRVRSDLELKQLKEKLRRNLRRIAMFDETLSDNELNDIENEMAAAAFSDPNARNMMLEVLNESFDTKDRTSIYFLDRVLRVSDPGRKALVDNYIKMVNEGGNDDFFALQGIHNHASGEIPEKEMGALFEKALAQLDKYESFSRYSPAMIFAATAMNNGNLKANPEQRRALKNKIQMHQSRAKEHNEFFFSAQSLLTMSDAAERNAVAESMIEKYPNRGTFEAILESIKVEEFEPSQRLMTTMESVARRLGNAGKH